MIYGDKQVVQRIAVLVDEFPKIWDSSDYVDIPPERWMTVLLKEDWQAKLVNINPNVYPLGVEARALVDEIFDIL